MSPSWAGPEEIRRRGAALGLLLSPALFAAGELVHHQAEDWPLLAAATSLAGLTLCMAAILGIARLLRPVADRIGLLGGAAAFLGVVAVSNIMLLQLVFEQLNQNVEDYPRVIDELFRRALFVTYLFGPVFPGGLAVLGFGLLRARVFPRWMASSFFVGALTFPAGRVGGVPALIHVTDLVLCVGAVAMGWQLWSRPELWARPATPGTRA